MTNAELEAIYKANLDISPIAALRTVWNAGYYEGAAVTPRATSPDKSHGATKPTAVLRLKQGT